jgi:hypothetical protein
LNKPANTRCTHLKFNKGCTIYKSRPFDCKVWSCRWLVDDEAAGLPRPDRAHYVIDIMPDIISVDNHDGAGLIDLQVLQIWVDPAFPDAHRAPALREYMQKMAAEHDMAALVRWGDKDAVVVFAPRFSTDGQWHERSSNLRQGQGLFG